jgi:hypothetical protein
MDSKPYFKNIRFHITEEIKKAETRIYVAMAWLTDVSLFKMLCQKAIDGLDVQLIVLDDAITQNYGPEYEILVQNGGKLYKVKKSESDNIMHHKFCIVDFEVTITGSYNWSKRAQGNDEHIVITRDTKDFTQQFVNEFKRLKFQYYGSEPLLAFDGKVILKRLIIMVNLLELEEYDELSTHQEKLTDYELGKDIIQFFDLLDQKEYGSAKGFIQSYLSRMQSIVIYEDISIERIRWEIQLLEAEVLALEHEKSSIEKVIHEFNNAYQQAFGHIIVEILRLKKEKFKEETYNTKSQEYEQAEYDFQNAQQEFKTAKENPIRILSDEDAADIKTMYKQAVKLCHPDKFTDAGKKKKAHEVFVKLQEAYQKNDFEKTKDILTMLKNGGLQIDEIDRISNREVLLAHLKYLKEQRDIFLKLTLALLKSREYKNVVSINKDKNFFAEEKIRLENELSALKYE